MDTRSHRTFGTLLRRHRLAAGLSQEELAERAGVSRRSIGDLERGVARKPHRDTITLLVAALGVQATERAAFVDAASRLRVPPATGRSIAPVAGDRAPGALRGQVSSVQLSLLERHLAGQGPPVLLLAGEPGIGKTRLLQVTGPRAIGHGLAVLEGGCQRRGGQEPYAPLLAALKGHIRRRTPAQQRVALRGCAWLVRLLPELRDAPIEPLPTWTLPPDQERRLMFEAVVRLVTNVAEQGTGSRIVLVLDDLQWAGSGCSGSAQYAGPCGCRHRPAAGGRVPGHRDRPPGSPLRDPGRSCPRRPRHAPCGQASGDRRGRAVARQSSGIGSPKGSRGRGTAGAPGATDRRRPILPD